MAKSPKKQNKKPTSALSGRPTRTKKSTIPPEFEVYAMAVKDNKKKSGQVPPSTSNRGSTGSQNRTTPQTPRAVQKVKAVQNVGSSQSSGAVRNVGAVKNAGAVKTAGAVRNAKSAVLPPSALSERPARTKKSTISSEFEVYAMAVNENKKKRDQVQPTTSNGASPGSQTRKTSQTPKAVKNAGVVRNAGAVRKAGTVQKAQSVVLPPLALSERKPRERTTTFKGSDYSNALNEKQQKKTGNQVQ